MDKICLVYGGDSVESDISILTALKIQKELEKYSYAYMMVFLDHDGNFYTGKALLNKNNYQYKLKFIKGNFFKDNNKCYFKSGLKKEYFDYVLLLVHGYKAEDGTIGGFFDTLKIPCIYPGLIQSALLQDKAIFKRVMSSLNINQANYEVLNEHCFLNNIHNQQSLTSLLFPLIVKPSHLGSSIAIKKVNNEIELTNALYEAYQYDNEVIIEEVVQNLKEINIAILKNNDELVTSNLERVNNKDKVLSFMDKYDNYSLNETHIIPADIDKKTSKKIIYLTKKIYSLLNLSSVVRFDYLVDEMTKKIYINEINAIPGSLAYYLFSLQDIDVCDLIDMLINEYKNKQKEKKITTYGENFLSILKAK